METGERRPTPARAARARRFGRAIALLVLVPFVVVAVGRLFADDPEVAVGRTSEALHPYDEAVFGSLPSLRDVTEEWGLGTWRHSGRARASGGAAIDDVNGDGRPDLVVGGGDLAIFLGPPPFRRVEAPMMPGSDVVAVAVADLDGDGSRDILVGMASGDDAIIWGDEASGFDFALADVDPLPGGYATTGLIVAELTGDHMLDVLRLGYASSDGRRSADVVFEQTDPRRFREHRLPDSDRLSLAAEVADVTGDGVPEIWVTRDLGWRSGGDSVYRRDGDGWHDIAPEIGADLAIDGMGVLLADLTGGGLIDAYLSDVGENDLLMGGDRFADRGGSGLGRIRAPGSPAGEVSSSWGAGVADLNLDGRIDVVVANGGMPGMTLENKVPDTTVIEFDTPSIFLGSGDGRYSDVWPQLGISARGAYRGLTIGDLDADTDQDLVLVDQAGGVLVLANDTLGGAIAVRSPCGIVQVGDVLAPARRHTIFGAHSPWFVVGVRGVEPVEVRFRGPRGVLRETVQLASSLDGRSVERRAIERRPDGCTLLDP